MATLEGVWSAAEECGPGPGTCPAADRPTAPWERRLHVTPACGAHGGLSLPQEAQYRRLLDGQRFPLGSGSSPVAVGNTWHTFPILSSPWTPVRGVLGP